MATRQFSEASITVVTGGFGEARDQAVEVAADAGLVLQPHMIGESWQSSLAMGLPGPGLMSPSPSGPPHRKVIIPGALPQQPA